MTVEILIGDNRETLKTLPDKSVQCCITSPPYFGLRSYLPENHDDKNKEIGLEQTPDQFVQELVVVFQEIKRILRDDGTVWLNLGDSYNGSGKGAMADGSVVGGGKQKTNKGTQLGNFIKSNVDGLKPKDLIGIPWRVAFALQNDGWYLRQDIIWEKPNAFPESVEDRCTKSHEYIFLLSKSKNYYFDNQSIKEPAVTEDGFRNKRSVWSIPTKPFKDAHFASFPEALVEPCILAGTKEGDVVIDPFGGAGTTGLVAKNNRRNAILCELNPEYTEIAKNRIFGSPIFRELFTDDDDGDMI